MHVLGVSGGREVPREVGRVQIVLFSFREIVGRYFVEHMPNVYIPYATNISFFFTAFS